MSVKFSEMEQMATAPKPHIGGDPWFLGGEETPKLQLQPPEAIDSCAGALVIQGTSRYDVNDTRMTHVDGIMTQPLGDKANRGAGKNTQAPSAEWFLGPFPVHNAT